MNKESIGKEDRSRNKKNIFRRLGVLYVIAFFGFIIYQHYEYGPISEGIKEQLESEFKLIGQLPSATLSSYRAHSRPEDALVSAKYNTKNSFSEIKKHYETELQKRGWTFLKEEGVKDWGKDLGGKSIIYCKERYSASIQYAGTEANYGWTYSLSLSWGLGACGVKYESKNKQLLIKYGSSLTCIAFIVIGSILLFLPKDKMIKHVFKKNSEDDFKDLVVFQVNIVLFRFFGIVGIVAGTFALKAVLF